MTNIISQVPYGILPGQMGIELFADRATKTMHFLRDGQRFPFSALPADIKASLIDKMFSDKAAMKDLHALPWDVALEKYCFCVYGAADSTPDIDENGEPLESDNFVCGNNCTCLKWKTKNITVNGHHLTPRRIEVINALRQDVKDTVIADGLHITPSTLNTMKKQLFEIFEVWSTSSLIEKAISLKVIQ